METPEYPSNSEASRKRTDEPRVERIVTGEVKRKRRSLGRQFRETFLAGDVKTAVQYTIFDIILLGARDIVADTINGITDKMLYGESRRRRGATPPQSGDLGYVAYNRYAMGQQPSRLSSPQRAISRSARARHDFDEIILETRGEAEDVLDQLIEVINRYGTATVADLYELLGLGSHHTDVKWGWTDARGIGVTRTRDGYLLDLPEPRPI